MTDGLSAQRREEREEEEEQRLRRQQQQQQQQQDPPKDAPKKRKRPIYDFPAAPDSDEEQDHADFVDSCLRRAEGYVRSDLLAAYNLYDTLVSSYNFPSLESDTGATRARVVLDIADRVTAERLREQRRRCAASLGASMQQP